MVGTLWWIMMHVDSYVAMYLLVLKRMTVTPVKPTNWTASWTIQGANGQVVPILFEKKKAQKPSKSASGLCELVTVRTIRLQIYGCYGFYGFYGFYGWICPL